MKTIFEVSSPLPFDENIFETLCTSVKDTLEGTKRENLLKLSLF